jgi:hypothetical protein
MISIEAFCIDHANVSWERVSGEVIAIQLNTGKYYSFSNVAADIWSLSDKGIGLEEILNILGKLYKQSENSDFEVREFISKCFSESLLIKCESESETSALPDDITRSVWITPQLTEYSDLQDLILVDPIHDVNDSGWPNLAQ